MDADEETGAPFLIINPRSSAFICGFNARSGEHAIALVW